MPFLWLNAILFVIKPPHSKSSYLYIFFVYDEELKQLALCIPSAHFISFYQNRFVTPLENLLINATWHPVFLTKEFKLRESSVI